MSSGAFMAAGGALEPGSPTSGAPEELAAPARISPARPLTILQLVPELNAGGVERGALEIAQAIKSAGGRAIVASADGRLATRLVQAGGESVIMPLASKSPATMMMNSFRIERLIRTEGVHLTHARSRAPAWSGYWATKRISGRFITTYHGAYSEGLPGKRLYNSVMAKGDPVIAISNFIAAHVQERHGVPPERIEVIPRGADTAVFDEQRTSPARVRALAGLWGLADDVRPVLMLPGRLTRWKGQTLFLEALAILKRRLGTDAFQGLIVGGGTPDAPMSKFEKELRRQIAQLGLADVARLVGHCDDMPAAYRLAAYAVSASLEPEAFGRVAVEAQAMGVPVIASGHGGAMETVVDRTTGWLFHPGSAEGLAVALKAALALSNDDRRRMGERARDHVRKNFSVAAMQERTLRVYEAAARRKF